MVAMIFVLPLPVDVTVVAEPFAGDTEATEALRVVHEMVTLFRTPPFPPRTWAVRPAV